jgi:protein involved in polysaccharide export with SLBB domain
MSRTFFRILFVVSFLTLSVGAFAQSLSTTDLSTVKVDNLTDEQIQQFKAKADASGMSYDQLVIMARSRGMNEVEIQKLNTRLNSVDSKKTTTSSTLNPTVKSTSEVDVFDFKVIKSDAKKAKEEASEKDSIAKKTFGYYLFNTTNLTFEPSQNLPTPKNYQLGAGDELSIDIWGASQANYILPVNGEGYINIPLVGPVFVNGLSFENASSLIKGRLRQIYAGLGQNTFAMVNVSKIRSIKVNILGEVDVPGSYSLSSLSSVFNALYVSGGPTYNGSFRNIKVMRANKQVGVIDVYNYLLNGDQSNNIKLQDQDVILVTEYKTKVQMTGEVKRPLIYEIKDKETLADAIRFAGGFTEKAYTHRVKIYRNTSREKQIFDVPQDSFPKFGLVNGDEIVVEPILERYENLVEINGAVYRSGKYSIANGLTLKKLIEKAEGLRGDAYLNRALIYRTKENLRIEAIPVNLEALMNGTASDIALVKDDQVRVFSLSDLNEEYIVSIFGEVQKPGQFPFVESMTLEDLIAQSGGFKEAASSSHVEVARRIKNVTASTKTTDQTQLFTFDLAKDLKFTNGQGSFVLEPYDQVFIRRAPAYEIQQLVSVTGQVNYPGEYALSSKVEKVSDLIERVGGCNEFAYVKGAKLIRKFNMHDILNILQNANGGVLDSLVKINTNKEQSVPIELDKIIENPGSKYDIYLEPGDELIVPRVLQTVGVNGAVLYPVQAKYTEGVGFKQYISQAGGFADNALKKKSFVIYANGKVKSTKRFMFCSFYPHIEPGAEIIVPRKPEEKENTIQQNIAIASALATMSLVVVSIVNLLK